MQVRRFTQRGFKANNFQSAVKNERIVSVGLTSALCAQMCSVNVRPHSSISNLLLASKANHWILLDDLIACHTPDSTSWTLMPQILGRSKDVLNSAIYDFEEEL